VTIKVLQFICPTGYYGAERWIRALVRSLDTSKIESHLCITKEAGASDEVIEHSKAFCASTHQIPMSSKVDISVIKKLVHIIKKLDIDIIHTHGYKSDILGIIAAKIAGIKSVCTPHGFENSEDKKLRAFMWLGGKAFRYFDVVCPLSPQIHEDLVNIYHLNENKIHLIMNGVDLYEVEEALSLQQNTEQTHKSRFVIGYIGQLISRKNLTALIEAFALFHKKQPDAELILIGDGEERKTLEQLSASLNLTEQVKFLGFIPNRLDYLPTFDVFAMTSSLEGIPRCIMEAMAARTCITAFNIPGVDQIVLNNETGLSVTFNDTEALAEAWQQLAENPARLAQLAEQGQKFVYDKFSSDAMAQNYTRLFNSLLTEQAN
jgi:glycosyltransferase involved in cell wall biosynthesis